MARIRNYVGFWPTPLPAAFRDAWVLRYKKIWVFMQPGALGIRLDRGDRVPEVAIGSRDK